MSAPLIARKTNYLKNNVPYYKYYQTEHISTDSEALFSSATATVGGQQCYVPAYSFKSTGPSSGNMPNSGAGMTTSIITPSTYNNHDVTLSAWIKPSQNNLQSKTIWGCHSDDTASGISFGMDDGNAGKLKFHAKSYGGVLQSVSKLSADTWYFIVCVYDRTNMQMRIYINGSLDNSKSMTTDGAYSLLFGYYIWKAGFWTASGASSKTASQACSQAFPGNIINACVWYRALSQSEITTLYNSGHGMVIDTSVAPYTDVAIAYPMNEQSGTVAYSAISGQDTGLYGSNTSYNQHAQESIFAGRGVTPNALYQSVLDWETTLTVDGNNEFVSTVSLTKGIVPTKFTVVFDNASPKNPQSLAFYGSTNNSTWTSLVTLTVPSNTNQTLELDVSTETAYQYYKVTTTSAYLTTGLTINDITINGYWLERNEVGGHSEWDERIEDGTHIVLSNEEDYDTVEYQNEEYEVQNV